MKKLSSDQDLKKKINDFFWNPDASKLFTLEEYNSLDDYGKGYVHYLQSSWPESEIHNIEPLTTEQFRIGSNSAMVNIMDVSE